MKEIYISINQSANLDLSIIMNDLKSFIEKYQSDIDFIEYHLSDDIDDPESNLIEYPNDYIDSLE